MKQNLEIHPSMQRVYEITGFTKPSQIAAAYNLAPSVISNWQKRGISSDGAILIGDSVKVSSNWILNGVETNFIEGSSRRIDDGMTIEQLDPRPVVPWDNATPLDKDEIAVPFFKDFIVSSGRGAIGEAVLQNESRRLRLSKSTLRSYGVDPAHVVAATNHGTSNIPTIQNKATVYIELGKIAISDITDCCFYGICHGGSNFFKRLYRLPNGGVRVVSDNKEEYPEYSLTKEQIKEQNFTIEAYAFDVQNPLPRR